MTKKRDTSVTIDRLDAEAFHRDLALISKWCRQSLYELAQADGGRRQWATITRVMCAAAVWQGRLSVVLGSRPTNLPLRKLGGENIAEWDRPGDELEESPRARRCRLRPSA